jgi:hypothetical protein
MVAEGSATGIVPAAAWALALPKAPPGIQEDKAMSDAGLKKELVGVWSGFREAPGAYRIDELRKRFDIPEGEPLPARARAEAFRLDLILKRNPISDSRGQP